MTSTRITFATLLAGALACVAGMASAADASALPAQPKARTGKYKIVSSGSEWIHAKCTEGGNVVVAAHPGKPLRGGAPATRDAALRDACKSLDYTK
jgi:hypothetical protein